MLVKGPGGFKARAEASGEDVGGTMGNAPTVNLAAILPALEGKVLVICNEDRAGKIRDEIKRLMPRSEMISGRNDSNVLYNITSPDQCLCW